jgi:hypothetical protein
MIEDAWAKILDSAPVAGGAAYLSLDAHCVDVAAVTCALLDRTLLGARIRTLAGIPGTGWGDVVAAIVGAAFLHDVGKCNEGFWRRQFDPPGTPPRRDGAKPRAGHLLEVAPLLNMRFPGPSRLSPRPAFLAPWLDTATGAGTIFLAALAHHGRPMSPDTLTCDALTSAAERDKTLWSRRPYGRATAAMIRWTGLAAWPGRWKAGCRMPPPARHVPPISRRRRCMRSRVWSISPTGSARTARASTSPAPRGPTDLQAAMEDLSLGPIAFALR